MRCTSSRSIELGVGLGLALALGAVAPAHAAVELEPTLILDLDARAYRSETEGLTGFALARLRPGLGVAPASWVHAAIAVELAGEHPEVLDAFVAFTPRTDLAVTVGLSKPPLFLSHREPIDTLAFGDVTAIAQSLRVNRDLGIGASWAPEALPIELFARIGNGSGSFLGNDNTELGYYLGLDLVLGRARRGSDDDLGLRLGVTGLYESAEDRLGVGGRTPLGFAYFRAPTVSGDRFVGEAHLRAFLGPIGVLVETGLSDEARSKDDDGNPATPRRALDADRSYGLSAELLWTSCAAVREPGRAPIGAVEVGFRLERLWLGQGADDLEAGGATSGTLSLKWWPTEFLALVALGTYGGYDVAPIEDPGRTDTWGALVRLSLFAGR